jgi:hypothetical protein
MTDDYVPQPRPPLTDATAAAILDFLYDLVADFEAVYATQLRRHNRATTQPRSVNPQQPWASTDDDPF